MEIETLTAGAVIAATLGRQALSFVLTVLAMILVSVLPAEQAARVIEIYTASQGRR